MTNPITAADVFAAAGQRTQLTAALRNGGYGDLELPDAGNFNYMLNEIYENILSLWQTNQLAQNLGTAPIATGANGDFAVAYPDPYAALNTNRIYYWKPGRDHQGAATLNIDGIGATPIKTPAPDGTLTDNNDFNDGEFVAVVFDGVNFVAGEFTPIAAATGTLTSVVAGTGISVDNTNPQAPVIALDPAAVVLVGTKQTLTAPNAAQIITVAGDPNNYTCDLSLGHIFDIALDAPSGNQNILFTNGAASNGQTVIVHIVQVTGLPAAFGGDVVLAANHPGGDTISDALTAAPQIFSGIVIDGQVVL